MSNYAHKPPGEGLEEEFGRIQQVAILPLRNVVLFPQMMAPLVVVRESSTGLVEETVRTGGVLGFVAQRDPDLETPSFEDLYEMGTIGSILKILKFPDGVQRILVQGIQRFRVRRVVETQPNLVVEAELLSEQDPDETSELLARDLVEKFRRFHNQSATLPPEMDMVINNIEHPGRLADFVASNLNLPVHLIQEVLELVELNERLKKVLWMLNRELYYLEISDTIQKEVQVAMDKSQREYYLKEQIKVIRRELGELDVMSDEIEDFRKRIKKARMPSEVEKEAKRELDRMAKIHPEAAEYTVSRTYLDWLVSLPWKKVTRDNPDFAKVQRILDEDHFGLEKVKERIVEYLAVRKLKADTKGPIICFLGPPGVGKTSLGKSIARALGRKFERISLGGIRDEAEIRGHRRTYIGAMPGRIIKAIKRCGTRNPVFMLDEIDKVGTDFRGDPASALLEVLDPEQNNTFTDHYLDVPFDLSQVMFIATANVLDPVPSALKDRMEVIELPGYIEEEKVSIAMDYLIPKQLVEHGLSKDQVEITREAVVEIIRHYTSEAGVRGMERKLARILRKVAKQVALNDREKKTITPDNLETYLGPIEYFSDIAERVDIPGIAIGLAWTATGGDILFIEASKMRGKKVFKITGQLGDVMRESAEAALTYLRANAEHLGLAPDVFDQLDIHVHVPAGAIPKDGPSAGVTLLTALTSLMRGEVVRSDLAMTGEITLRGKVLPVGGIKEKVLAARRAGIREVVLPTRNRKDLVDIPAPLQEGMTFHFVENVDEVIQLALGVQLAPRAGTTPESTERAAGGPQDGPHNHGA